MKTNTFPILFLPTASKAMKANEFPILFLTRASMKIAPKASKEPPKPENGPDVYRAHIAFWRIWQTRHFLNTWLPELNARSLKSNRGKHPFQPEPSKLEDLAMKTNVFPILFLPRASKSLENAWFSNTFPSQSFEKQWQPTVFQYVSFLEFWKPMKTKGFPILFLPRASKSNEHQ